MNSGIVAPDPIKFICQQCGYSKIVKQKSDALDFEEIFDTCPKCNAKMKIKKLNVFDVKW